MNTIRQKIFCFYLGYYKKQALKLVLFNTVSTCCKSWLMRASFPALNTVHGEWIHFSYSSSGSHLLTAGEAGQVKGRDAPWGPGKPRTRSCLILPRKTEPVGPEGKEKQTHNKQKHFTGAIWNHLCYLHSGFYSLPEFFTNMASSPFSNPTVSYQRTEFLLSSVSPGSRPSTGTACRKFAVCEWVSLSQSCFCWLNPPRV